MAFSKHPSAESAVTIGKIHRTLFSNLAEIHAFELGVTIGVFVAVLTVTGYTIHANTLTTATVLAYMGFVPTTALRFVDLLQLKPWYVLVPLAILLTVGYISRWTLTHTPWEPEQHRKPRK